MKKNVGGAEIIGSGLSSTYSGTYNMYLNLANNAYLYYNSDTTIGISLSTKSLTFILNGDNYESNSITVSGVSDYSVKSNVGNILKNGSSFKVIIPANSITNTTAINVTVSSSKTVELASNYNCGGSYQSLTPVLLESKTITDSEQASGTISSKAKLTINKVDGNNKLLNGATIVVTGTKGYNKTFTTSGSSIVINDLEYDTYTIKETKAPDGYIIAKQQVVTLNESNSTQTITMTDTKTKTAISKVDVTNNKELPGSTLEIQDKNGNVVNYCKGSAACRWVSTNKPYEIEGLPAGKYYLVETEAPKGYVLNQEKIEFEIKEDTTTLEVSMKNDLEVEVPDTLSSRSAILLTISMIDIAIGIGIVTYIKKTKVKGN